MEVQKKASLIKEKRLASSEKSIFNQKEKAWKFRKKSKCFNQRGGFVASKNPKAINQIKTVILKMAVFII